MTRAQHDDDDRRLMTRADVLARVRVSKSTLHRMMRSAGFPPPVRFPSGSVRWIESEVDAWIARQPRAGRKEGAA